MRMSNPIVTFNMEDGQVIKAELYTEIAPNTDNNVISLIRKGFYNGLTFHRVIKGFMIRAAARWAPAQVDRAIISAVNSR